jgi:hypothetical protein
VGVTIRFLEEPDANSVLEWFRDLPEKPDEVPAQRSTVLYFHGFGPLVYDAAGRIDTAASPVATLFAPRLRRNALWTVGEVHFLPAQLRRRFPGLHRVAGNLTAWLSSFDCVFARSSPCEYSHFLEGSVRNEDSSIFALPSGVDALTTGRYFVSENDGEERVEVLCKQLRLRGVECADV